MSQFKLGVAFLNKKRNNSPTNLALGLWSGLEKLTHQLLRVELDYDGNLDVEACRELDALIIPYWISRDIFSLNLSELKSECPTLKILPYTGTQPYWEGCPWVTFEPRTGKLNLGTEATEEEGLALQAIDHFLTVWSVWKSERETSIGMGFHPELGLAEKVNTPCIILDHFKPGWDETVFDAGVKGLAQAYEQNPDFFVLILGQVTLERVKQLIGEVPPTWHLVTQNNFVDFPIMAAMYASTWAMLVHNESFGFPVGEAATCGTQVFASWRSELPMIYRQFVTTWRDPVDLCHKLIFFLQNYNLDTTPVEVRNKWMETAERFQLNSWDTAAVRAIEVIQNLKET